MIENYRAYGAFKPTGATFGLNVDITGAVTASAVNEGIYHTCSSTWTGVW